MFLRSLWIFLYLALYLHLFRKDKRQIKQGFHMKDWLGSLKLDLGLVS